MYLAGATVAVVCLAWLAIRQLHQDAALDEQRTMDRLQGAANLAAARSLQALVDLERMVASGAPPSSMPPHTRVVRVHEDGGFTVEGGSLPFVPAGPAATAVPEGVYDTAERLELAPGEHARAVAVYRALTLSPSPPVRAGASMRLARALRRQARPDEALKAYADLAQFTDIVIEGRPADLVARLGRASVLETLGQRDDLEREAVALRADLANGRWPVTPALWASVFADATRWAGASAPAIAGLDEAVAAAGALERYWHQRGGDPATGTSRAAVETPLGLALVIAQVHDGVTRVLVAGPSHVEAMRQQLSDSTTQIRLLLPEAKPDTQRPASSVLLRASETGLPWTIVAIDADPERARAESRTRRTTFLAGLALVAALILASGYFTFRGIRREIATARLHSEFVSAVSHEFRTPLTSIRQLSHMLRSGRVASDERRGQYYEVLVRESERLHRLVERLLRIGRADAGKFQVEPLDARDLARAVVDDFVAQPGAHAVDVQATAAACLLRADRDMLSLALWNLLDNAVKYSPGGGQVRVDVTRHDGRVAMAVQDQGVGIAPDDQRRIFETFVRGSADRVAETSGSGLGLALVDRVVRGHGGSVTLASEPGRGSTFTMWLPAVDDGMRS